MLFTGDVRFAEIKMENGRSKGVGVVRFATPELAKRAVGILLFHPVIDTSSSSSVNTSQQ